MSSSVLNRKFNFDSLCGTGATIGNGGLTVGSTITGQIINASSGELDLNVNNGFVAPSTTSAPFANLKLANTNGGGTAGTPLVSLQLNQINPNLAPVPTALQAYSTTALAGSQATSNAVLRAGVASAPIAIPALSAAGLSNTTAGAPFNFPAHTQVAVADVILCTSITANSVVRVWLAGLSGVVGATAVAAGTVSAVVPGTSFTLNGTVGAIYGYEVLHA